MKRALLVLAVLILPWSGAASAREGVAPGLACSAAATVLGQIKDDPARPWVFQGSSVQTLADFDMATPEVLTHRFVLPPKGAPDNAWDEAYGWSQDPPSRALAERFLAASQKEVLSICPDLGGKMRRRGFDIDIDATIEPVIGRDGAYTRTFMKLSLPVVSDDGLEALATLDQTGAPRAGGGEIYHLRRSPGGTWTIVDTMRTWVT